MSKNTEHTRLLIHSQAVRPGSPLDMRTPQEVAFEARALMLNLKPHDVVFVSAPLPEDYSAYYTRVLRLPLPQMISPTRRTRQPLTLSEAILQDPEAIGRIKELQEEGRAGFVTSFFDVTPQEEQVFAALQEAGVQVKSEIQFRLAEELGNKSVFRNFCKEYGIPQLPGGIFTDHAEAVSFIQEHQVQQETVIVKHPYGTAGEGTHIITPTTPIDDAIKDQVASWIEGAGSVVAERFSPNGGEHALHVYIDPVSHEANIVGIYDQLVKTNEHGELAHYGCKNMKDQDKKQALVDLAKSKIIPALLEKGYTGPACFDVLSYDKKNPEPTEQPFGFHFMEINTRTGANMYAHRFAERVAKAVYGQEDPEQVAIMFLASLPHQAISLTEFVDNKGYLFIPQPDGMVIVSNPARLEFGQYDIIAFSPNGSMKDAECLMQNFLERAWDKKTAKMFLEAIYR